MSNVSVANTDMSEFEAQLASSIGAQPTRGQLRVRGWVIVLAASVVLWAVIAAGIAAAIHALA
jgi:hypothetical protein